MTSISTKHRISRKLRRRKQRIHSRLRPINWEEQGRPMLSVGNIHYGIADRAGGLAFGGIGGMHLAAVMPLSILTKR